MLTLYFLGRLEVPNTAWVCTYRAVPACLEERERGKGRRDRGGCLGGGGGGGGGGPVWIGIGIRCLRVRFEYLLFAIVNCILRDSFFLFVDAYGR